MGWIGGGWAPLAVGYIARDHGLSAGITAASVVYLIACGLLLLAAFFFAEKDIWQTQTQS